MWVNSGDIHKSTGISTVTLSNMRNKGHAWVRKEGSKVQFDIDHPGFNEWCSSASEASKRRKRELEANALILSGTVLNEESKTSSEECSDEMIEKARTAKYQSIINNAELGNFKIELQKIELEKVAGNLHEDHFVKFAYYGYLERFNQEMLLLPKQFKQIIEHLLTDHIINSPDIQKIENDEIREAVISVLSSFDRAAISAELVKLNIREYEEIIRNVKKSQLEDIDNWAKDQK